MNHKSQCLRLMLIASIFRFCRGTCEFPWIQPGNDSPCYAVSTEALNFYNADKFCATHGGFLAEPRTAEETNLIELFVMPEGNYWIGLTDLADEGAFVWGTDYSAPDYTNWISGQPDNEKGDEDCAHLYGKDGLQWNDAPCTRTSVADVQLHALCQKPS